MIYRARYYTKEDYEYRPSRHLTEDAALRYIDRVEQHKEQCRRIVLEKFCIFRMGFREVMRLGVI